MEKTKKDIYKELSKPLPQEAIQRTKKSETKKGYDTTGYGYQFIVNRFNEVLGIGGWSWGYKVIRIDKGSFQSGQSYYEITAEATIRVGDTEHTEPGGHRSSNYPDALKGATTNAFKKTAAFFGVGKDAYEGSIDPDNVSRGDYDENVAESNELPTPKQLTYLKTLLTKSGFKGEQAHLKQLSIMLNTLIVSYNELTKQQASRAIEALLAPDKAKEEYIDSVADAGYQERINQL